MCNCINETADRIVAEQPVKNRRILEVKLPKALHKCSPGKLKLKPAIEFVCRMEGYAARKNIAVPIHFCPFCGAKLEE